MADIEILELEDFALELAHTAGGIAQAHFRRPVTVENKSETAFDPVTNADRAIERVLRTAIDARYPDHGIVAEEEGERLGRGEYTWFIDPIDGTRSFMTGSPLWGTLIGLTQRGKPLFGLLVQPVLEEVFLGGPSGSWLIKADRRDRLKSRACKSLAKAMLGCTHPDMFAGQRAKAFRSVSEKCLLTRFGGDCYNYAMVAAGYLAPEHREHVENPRRSAAAGERGAQRLRNLAELQAVCLGMFPHRGLRGGRVPFFYR